MGVSDGTIIGLTQIRDRGAESLNWNLVITGDGFTSAEQSLFESSVDDFVNELLSTPPFDLEVDDMVNIFRLDVHSDESGADNPATCDDGTSPFGGVATTARTYFDAGFCNEIDIPVGQASVRRLMYIDIDLVFDTVDLELPEWNAIVVIVNHAEYGGAGYDNAAVYALGASSAAAVHELGHSAFDLADEYDTYAGCSSGETTQDSYTGSEPDEPNVTINTDLATLKWASYVDAATPIPTTQNPDCTQCDTQANPVSAGTVGLFEGAFHYHCGAYRPEYNCKMRESLEPFCAVCAGKIAGTVRSVLYEGCFVATAVYQGYAHPDVKIIRNWRNHYVRQRHPGMVALAAIYRVVGPPLACWVVRRRGLARVVRKYVLAPFARWLR